MWSPFWAVGLLLIARLVPEGRVIFCASLIFLCTVSTAGARGWKPGVLTTVLSFASRRCSWFGLITAFEWGARAMSCGSGSVLVGVAISIFCEALHREWGESKTDSSGWNVPCSSCRS